MIRFYTKSYDKVPTSMDKNYICTQGEGKKIINCAICGKVEVSYTYTVYTFNGKDFCSWNCKSKYRKAHPEEVELTESEKIVAKFMDVGDRYINNRTNVNLNKPPQPVAYVCYVDGVKYSSIKKAGIEVFNSLYCLNNIRDRLQSNEFDYKGHHIKVVPYGEDENE